MSNKPTKIRILRLQESISKLQSQKTVASDAGNKVKLLCIEKLIARFEAEIEKLKTY